MTGTPRTTGPASTRDRNAQHIDNHEPSVWIVDFVASHINGEQVLKQCRHITYTCPVDQIWISVHDEVALCAACLDAHRATSVCDRCGEPFGSILAFRIFTNLIDESPGGFSAVIYLCEDCRCREIGPGVSSVKTRGGVGEGRTRRLTQSGLTTTPEPRERMTWAGAPPRRGADERNPRRVRTR